MPRRLFVLVLVPVALAAVGASNGLSARSAGPTLQQQLTLCKQDLVKARDAVGTADELIGIARRGDLTLMPFGDALVPISVERYRDFLFLSLAAGELTNEQLKARLKLISHAAATTSRALKELAAEARENRDSVDKRCAEIAKKLGGTGEGGAGSLEREGKLVPTPDSSKGLPYTWDLMAASNKATIVTPYGKATYTWEVPGKISKAGTTGSITVAAGPLDGQKGSNLATNITVAGEVDFFCGDSKTSSATCTAEAYTREGETVTGTVKFTVKPRPYSPGRTQPVYLEIKLGPNGPGVKIPYSVVE